MGSGDTISLDSQSDLGSASEQIGLATYVAAVAFNSAALPANMPAWLKASIGDKATALKTDPNNPFLMSSLSARETIEKREKDQAASTRTQLILIAQEQERERSEWARTNSTVGGVTMTGAEWGDLAKRMREDEDFHRRLIELFQTRGMSEQEAEARYDRVAEAAEIAAIPPSQRTEEQNAITERNDADPTFQRDVADMKRESSRLTAPPSDLNSAFTSAHDGAIAKVENSSLVSDQGRQPSVQIAGAGM